MQSAAKVGGLVLVFIVLVAAGYSFLGSNLFGPGSDQYYATFSDAAGTPVGARVLMAGVQVGTVSGVTLKSPSEAVVSLKLQKGLRIPLHSEIQIPGSLIGLADQMLVIVPPPSYDGQYYSPGQTIPGRRLSGLDEMLQGKGNETLANLNKTLTSVQKLLANKEMLGHVNELMESTNKTMESAMTLTQNMSVLVNRMNGFLASNQSKLSDALTSGAKAVEDVHRITYEFSKYVQSGKVQKNTDQIFASLTSAAKKADDLVASMNSLVNDPAFRANVNRIVDNTASITENGKAASANAVDMTKSGEVIAKNGITLSEKANEIATKASAIEDQLHGVLDKVGGFFGGGKPKTNPLQGLTYEMDLFRTTHPNYWRTDINFKLPLSDQDLDFGIYDALASNKITLELGKPVNKQLTYRYGIYASQVAGGVDYRFTPRLSLRTDLWNINNPYLDVMLGYEFGNGLLGWIGMDHTFNGNSALIGIGVRR